MGAADGRVGTVLVVDAPFELAGRVAERLTALAAMHGGCVEQSTGARLIATFDVLSEAVQAAAELMLAPDSAQLRCAMVGYGGGDTEEGLGDAVASAGHMCQSAQPGQLVVSARPAATAHEPGPSVLDVMVGRDKELSTLADALSAAEVGRPQVLTLVGELGAGRTAMLAHVRSIAWARGFAVLQMGGAEGAVGGRWASLRSGVVSTPPAGSPRRLAEWLPSFAADKAPDDATLARELLGQLSKLTDDHPVLVTVDDVDRLDDSSRSALRLVATGLAVERCMLLAASPNNPDQWLGGDLLPLRELAADAVQLIIERDGPIAPAVLRRCVELAAGNALAGREMSRSLSPRQRSGQDPIPAVPAPAAAVLGGFRELLAQATPSARRAAVVAAADDTGDPEVIRTALVGLGEDPSGLEEAEDAGLLHLEAAGLRFAHPLLRSVAYHQVAASSRRAAHKALAVALGRPRQATARAYQLAAAAVGPNEAASEALALVAESELRRGDAQAAGRACATSARLTADEALRERRLARAALLYLRSGDLGSADAALGSLGDSTILADAVIARCLVDLARMGPTRARANLARSSMSTELAATIGALGDYLDALAGDPPAVTDRAQPMTVVARALAGAAPASTLLDLEYSPGTLGVLEASLAAHALALGGWSIEAGAIIRQLELDPGAVDRVGMQATAGLLALDAGRVITALEILGDAATTPVAGSVPDAMRLLALARARLYCGRLDDSEDALKDATAIIDRLGVVVHEAEAELIGALVQHARGHEEGVERLTRAALRRPDRALPELVVATLDRRGETQGAWAPKVRSLLESPDRRVSLAARRALAALTDDREELISVAKQQQEAALELEAVLTRGVMVSTALRIGSPDGARLRDEDAKGGAKRGIVYPGSIFWQQSVRRDSVRDKLSPAEHRVAVAVGTGATNKEVSAQLFISVKTVDYHLQNIYRKLGARSRTELAVLLAGSAPERGSGR